MVSALRAAALLHHNAAVVLHPADHSRLTFARSNCGARTPACHLMSASRIFRSPCTTPSVVRIPSQLARTR
eukprot:474986-Pleurochrysis_carterae.AAC.1